MNRFAAAAAAAALSIAYGASASAQSDPREAQEKPQWRLDLSVSGAYDDNVLATRTMEPTLPRASVAGWYAGSRVDAGFDRPGSKMAFGLGSLAFARYYPDLDELLTTAYGVGGWMSVAGRATQLRITQSYRRAPSSILTVTPTAISLPLETDLSPIGLDPMPGMKGNAWDGSAALEQRLGRRTTLLANYQYRHLDAPRGQASHENHRPGILLTKRISRHAALRGGYALNRIAFRSFEGELGRQDLHEIEAGLDYQRSFSMRRGLTVGFHTGALSLAREDRRVQRLALDAFLSQRAARTWELQLDFRHGSTLLNGFDELFFADVANARVSGNLTERLALQVHARGASGSLGPVARDRNLSVAGGLARLIWTWHRSFTTALEYFHERYDLDRDMPLTSAFPPERQRQGAQVVCTVRMAPPSERRR